MQLKCKKKICAVYGEGAVIKRVEGGLQSFMLEMSCWMMFHSRVDQLKLIAIKLRHNWKHQHYTIQEIANISKYADNKVIDENENYLFYRKKPYRHFGQPNTI